MIHDNSGFSDPTTTASKQPTSQFRRFRNALDAGGVRDAIFSSTLHAAKSIQPLTNQQHTLSLHDVDYAPSHEFSEKERKHALLSGNSLTRKLRGTWKLTDNLTGQEVASKKTTLADVPEMTRDGTFVNNGVEFSLSHQQRLKPGVYTRRKLNGDLEAHLNTRVGTGMSHHVHMDPATGIFKLHVGQAHMPLYPLLRSLGASDKDLETAWGRSLYHDNKQHDTPQVITKLHARFGRADSPDSHEKQVADAFRKMELDPEVTSRTLGHPHKHVDAATLLATTKKLLAVHKGETEPDDRDSPIYQTILGPEDLISERLSKDKASLRNMLWKASARGNLDHVHAGMFNPAIQAALLSSGLGMPGEEVNDLELLDNRSRISRADDEVPMVSQDTYVMTTRGWVLWPEVRDDDRFVVQVDGRLEHCSAERIIRMRYSGTMIECAGRSLRFCFTAGSKLCARHRHPVEWNFVPAIQALTDRWLIFPVAGPAMVGRHRTAPVIIPEPPVKSNRSALPFGKLQIPRDLWLDFFGYYLADGSTSYHPERSEYRIEVAKKLSRNPGECERIERCLSRLPFRYRYEQDRRFIINSKHLAYFLKNFGPARAKYIPRELFEGDPCGARLLLDSLCACDGRWCGNSFYYETASTALALQVSEIVMSLGWTMSMRFRHLGPTWIIVINRNVRERCPAQKRWKDKSMPYREIAYDGYVFGARMKRGLLLAMYHGSPLWIGNPQDAMRASFKPVPDRFAA